MKSKKKKKVKDWKEVLIQISEPSQKEIQVNGQEMIMTDQNIIISDSETTWPESGLTIKEPNGTEVVFTPEQYQKIKQSNRSSLNQSQENPPENLFCSKKFTKKENLGANGAEQE